MGEAEARFRHELKYIVSAAQISLLESRIAVFMQRDPHTGKKGWYSVRSLYFDDYDNRCYDENENGTDPREKYRIRIYNHSLERISLECKRKERGKTLKTSTTLSPEESKLLIEGIARASTGSLPPLFRRVNLQMKTRLLRPAVIVEYDRIPYIYRDGNVRVTFDLNVSSSPHCARFFEERLPRRPVMPPGMFLMEVKFDEFMPDFLYRGLNLGTLQQVAYSKYYLCRKFA